MEQESERYEPFAGAWGRQGCTRMALKAARKPVVRQALLAAWRNVAPQHLVERFDEEDDR